MKSLFLYQFFTRKWREKLQFPLLNNISLQMEITHCQKKFELSSRSIFKFLQI